jgi:hypothetical protein
MNPELAGARYVNVTTFRRDGRAVATPVWCVALDDRLYFFSGGDSGKVKRIRATGRVLAAPSDVRGRVLGGSHEGRGRVVDAPDLQARFYAALTAKYGWQFRVLNFFSTLARRRGRRAVLEVAF